jgi:hypothetical protein
VSGAVGGSWMTEGGTDLLPLDSGLPLGLTVFGRYFGRCFGLIDGTTSWLSNNDENDIPFVFSSWRQIPHVV